MSLLYATLEGATSHLRPLDMMPSRFIRVRSPQPQSSVCTAMLYKAIADPAQSVEEAHGRLEHYVQPAVKPHVSGSIVAMCMPAGSP
jgi:hypothetical protein